MSQHDADVRALWDTERAVWEREADARFARYMEGRLKDIEDGKPLDESRLYPLDPDDPFKGGPELKLKWAKAHLKIAQSLLDEVAK